MPDFDEGFWIQDFELNQAGVLLHVDVCTSWLSVLEFHHVGLDLQGKEKGQEAIHAFLQRFLSNKLENCPGVHGTRNSFLCFFE